MTDFSVVRQLIGTLITNALLWMLKVNFFTKFKSFCEKILAM
jgi:hypothetical protein